MKKITIATSVLMIIQGTAISQGCLVEGAVFTTQNQIDSFQINYPGCTEILGGMTISGSDVTNLQGLEVLTTIWNGLVIEDNPALTSLAGLDNVTHAWAYVNIENNDALTSLEGLEGLERIESTLKITFNAALTSLSGLENLTSTSGAVYIYYNDSLASLSGLQGLTSIAGNLYLESNPMLTSLDGLGSIAGSSITNLTIRDNAALSTCEVQSVCDYLVSPSGTVEIHSNASGCNSQEEVEEACGSIGVQEINGQQPTVSCHPNPAEGIVDFQLSVVDNQRVIMKIFDLHGREMATVVDRLMPAGQHKVTFDFSGLPSGIYLYRILPTVNRQLTMGKLVVVR